MATDDSGKRPGDLVPSDFVTLVMSLGQACLVHLGQAADESSAATPANLPMAQQAIDMLAMLETKTQGNLTDDEAEVLHGVLYQVRMAFVAARNAPGA